MHQMCSSLVNNPLIIRQTQHPAPARQNPCASWTFGAPKIAETGWLNADGVWISQYDGFPDHPGQPVRYNQSNKIEAPLKGEGSQDSPDLIPFKQNTIHDNIDDPLSRTHQPKNTKRSYNFQSP